MINIPYVAFGIICAFAGIGIVSLTARTLHWLFDEKPAKVDWEYYSLQILQDCLGEGKLASHFNRVPGYSAAMSSATKAERRGG